QLETHQRGKSPEQELIDRLKNETLPVIPNDKNITEVKTSADNSVTPLYVWNSWYGPNQNGWVPADVDIAKGPNDVIIVTNEQFHIYTSTNFSQISTSTLQTFFTPVGSSASIFDPKVIYD